MRPLALALTVLATLGCDRLLGIEDIPRQIDPVDASGVDTHVDFDNVACTTCSESQCATAHQACLDGATDAGTGDQRCKNLLDCLRKCTPDDPACRRACETGSTLTKSTDTDNYPLLEPYRAVDACRREKCTSQCFANGKGLVKAIDAKCACMDDLCADRELACVQSDLGVKDAKVGGCERRVTCVGFNPNPDGTVTCTLQASGGKQYNQLLDCARNNDCTTAGQACPLRTGELACLGNFDYRTAREEPSPTFGVTGGLLADLGNFKALPGATVTACNGPSCATCAGGRSMVTDAEGAAKIKVPISSLSAGAYTGCLWVTPPGGAGDLPPLMVYTGRNIHVDESVLSTVIIERDIFSYYSKLDGDVSVDWTNRGHLIGTLHDCIWLRTVGATIELHPDLADSTTLIRYLKGTDLNPDGKTGPDGAFAIVNLKPGRGYIRAVRDKVVVAELTIDVVAGKQIDVNLYPKAK